MSWGVNPYGAKFLVCNSAVNQTLAEIPRPKNASKEQISLAETLVDALLAQGFLQGPHFDKGLGMRELRIREFLWAFVAFRDKEKRLKNEYEVDEIARNLGVYTPVGEATIRKFVTFCGFSSDGKDYKQPERPKGATQEMIQGTRNWLKTLEELPHGNDYKKFCHSWRWHPEDGKHYRADDELIGRSWWNMMGK